jgi:predicted porin
MNRTFLATLCAAACGASPAYAQSSVTLYGLTDVGVTALSNQAGHRNLVMDTGVLVPNLFGLHGVEDLGGGMKATFTLEGQYEIGTGALDGNEFGRQAFVGLTSNEWGALTMGNQYDYMFTSLSEARLGPEFPYVSLTNLRQGPFAALGKPEVPTGDFDFDRTAGAQRVANSVRYQAPQINNFTFGAMYGFSNEAGAFSNGSSYSFGADYTPGPFSIDAAYTMVKYAAINNGNDGIRNFGIGGRVAVLKGWADVLYTNTYNTFTGAMINVGEIGGTYPLSISTTVALAYEYMKGNAVLQNNKAHQVNLTLDYALSKSTDVYVSAAYQRASGDSDTATAFILDTAGASSNGNQTALRFGLRHFF